MFIFTLRLNIGLLFKDKIEHISNNVKIIGFFLIVTALFLLSIKNIRGSKDDDDISLREIRETLFDKGYSSKIYDGFEAFWIK